MTATEIRQVALHGSNDDVIKAYLSLTGRNIASCKECVQNDARYNLLRMAQTLENNAGTLSVRLKKEYWDWNKINGVGEIRPLTAEKIAAITELGFGYIFEPVEVVDVTPEPEVAPEPEAPKPNGKAK